MRSYLTGCVPFFVELYRLDLGISPGLRFLRSAQCDLASPRARAHIEQHKSFAVVDPTFEIARLPSILTYAS